MYNKILKPVKYVSAWLVTLMWSEGGSLEVIVAHVKEKTVTGNEIFRKKATSMKGNLIRDMYRLEKAIKMFSHPDENSSLQL